MREKKAIRPEPKPGRKYGDEMTIKESEARTERLLGVPMKDQPDRVFELKGITYFAEIKTKETKETK